MKIKEIPKSIARMCCLLKIPKAKLGEGAKEASPEVIISLTSIPYRLPKLHLVIRSLLDQTVRFKKVILWLNEDLAAQVPSRLDGLQSERFEIKFSKSTSSHRKLVETLKVHPESYIVTCDDDMMYPRDWLERLLREHAKHPEAIVAHMCREFKFDENGIMPYRHWGSEKLGQGTDRTLAVGWGGVLYPPGSLHEDVLNEALYMKLAPKADDFWFKAMSFKNGTAVIKSSEPNPEPIPIMLTQKYSLKKENIKGDANRDQWINISNYYGIEVK
ncbi:glycosyltransferase family 2 protein [Leucothrix sargassi]|nr:glycosyltransferase family 2 protein [Leucothrix sargassi]